MVEKKKERVSIFVDGSNLYHGLKVIGMSINDFERFANLIAGDRDLRRVYYYTAMMDRDFNEEGFIRQQKFLRKLSSIPKFKLVFCTCQEHLTDNSTRLVWSVFLSIQSTSACHKPHLSRCGGTSCF